MLRKGAHIIALLSSLIAQVAVGTRDPPFDTTKAQFSGVFTNDAILQRAPNQAVVYGTATPDHTVEVSLMGPGGYNFTSAPIQVVISADPTINGTWRTLLPARPPGFGYTIEASCPSCPNATSAIITDVGFGDVYLCSGQSNMECPVLTTIARNESYAEAASGKYAHIRLFQTGYRMSNRNASSWILPLSEHSDGGYPQRTWAMPGGNDKEGSLNRFSAACWYFGKSLSDLMNASAAPSAPPVPLGLIASMIGGTTIQEWMPPGTTSNATCLWGNCGFVEQLDPNAPPVQPATLPQCTNASQETVWSCPSGLCSTLWEGMIAPYVNMTIAGAVWYQGEQNVAYGRGDAGSGYQCQQAAMIAAWREAFSAVPGTSAPDFPFGVTTLAGGCSEGFPLWSPFQHAGEQDWRACATTRGRGAACQDMVDDWAGGLRAAQTGGYGHAPNPALPNVFLGQGFDQGEPCQCDRSAPYPGGCWANGECFGDGPYSLNLTWNYQNSAIHPRVKHVIGERLARGLWGLLQARPQPTPKLAGCRLEQRQVTLSFDASLLGAESVLLQAPPVPGGLLPLQFLVGPANATSSGWVYAAALEAVNATAVAAVLPAGVGVPTAVRYAWGNYPCCPGQNASTAFCPPGACPIVTSVTREPAVPFWAAIVEGKCSCAAPWTCDA